MMSILDCCQVLSKGTVLHELGNRLTFFHIHLFYKVEYIVNDAIDKYCSRLSWSRK